MEHSAHNRFIEKGSPMKKIAILAAALTAAVATPALAGTGTAYGARATCEAAVAAQTFTIYEPGMVSSRERVSRPMNEWRSAGLTGPTCVEEHVRVSEIDGRRLGDQRTVWAWVVVPGEVIVTNGTAFADMRCANQIRVVARRQIVACTDCNRPAPQPAPQPVARQQVQVGLIQAPAVATTVTYRQPRAPIQVSLVSLAGPPPAGSVYVGGSSNYTSYNYTMPNTVPPFGGVTQPPAGNGFGGVTQPPSDNGFGGQTQPPAPVPGPQPVGQPLFGGVTAGPVPAPVYGNGGFYNGGNQGGVQGPVFNGGNLTGGPLIVDNFGGTTSTFTGSTGVILPPSGGSGNTFVNGGVQGPVQGPVTGGNGGTNPGFGGNTNGQ